jgi:hypothetical protein
LCNNPDFPFFLGTPGLSKFKCSLHFDDDADPYFELKAEGTAKKEQLVAFLEERRNALDFRSDTHFFQKN